MTLDEAIEHAEWCARESHGECAEEHRQLAAWLSELKRLKAQNKWLRRWYTALMESHQKAFAESCKTATNNLLKICKLNDENEKLRQLVHHMCVCMCNIVDADYECDGCPMDNDTQNCDFERRMEELGIEVER